MLYAVTTIALALLTLLAIAASALALRRFVNPASSSADAPAAKGAGVASALIAICGLGAAAVFLFRWLVVHEDWSPLDAHVDGLTLIASLLAFTMLYIQSRARLTAIVAFASPVLALVLAWSVCASHWTLRSYHIGSAWSIVHFAGVYIGTAFLAIACVAGVLFLVRQRQLRAKAAMGPAGGLGSLEGIETIIVRSAAVGFGTLTLGLIAGLVVVASGPTRLGPGWWHSPKVLLAAAVWLIYGLVTNIRHATQFRGARAAWLSIVGFVLLLITFAVVQALPSSGSQPAQREAVPVSSREARP